MISQLDNPDIIILPEMFSTGFTANSESQSEPARSETFDWMIHVAEKSSSGICGSYIVRVGDDLFQQMGFCLSQQKVMALR